MDYDFLRFLLRPFQCNRLFAGQDGISLQLFIVPFLLRGNQTSQHPKQAVILFPDGRSNLFSDPQLPQIFRQRQGAEPGVFQQLPLLLLGHTDIDPVVF